MIQIRRACQQTRLIKPVLFIIVFAVVLHNLQPVFSVRDSRIRNLETEFYDELPASLDGIYIGASNAYAFQPPLAWDEYGIAVYSYAIPSMMYNAAKYIMIETRKTQPNALFLININFFKNEGDPITGIHRIADHMPWSLNKIRMIWNISKDAGIRLLDRLEFFVPIIRFHSGWSDLKESDFNPSNKGLKGSYYYKGLMTSSVDISGKYKTTDKKAELSEQQKTGLSELLDYIDQEHVNVLFISFPQVADYETLELLNTIEDIIVERGYPCLDYVEKYDETGLLLDVDFMDNKHANIHGVVKYTESVSRYLVEHYGYKDKRSQSGWESWDHAAELYEDIISEYTLPFEREHGVRDNGLPEPTISKVSVDGRSITVSWSESIGAEGYYIYRKASSGDKSWECISELGAGTTDYVDENLKKKTTYTYTVVPFRTDNGMTVYGRFNYSGISGKTGG